MLPSVLRKVNLRNLCFVDFIVSLCFLTTLPRSVEGLQEFLPRSRLVRNIILKPIAASNQEHHPENSRTRGGWRQTLHKVIKKHDKASRKDSVLVYSQRHEGSSNSNTHAMKRSKTKGKIKATNYGMSTMATMESESTMIKLFSDFELLSPQDVFPTLNENFTIAVSNGTDAWERETTLFPKLDVQDEEEVMKETKRERKEIKFIVNSLSRSTLITTAIKIWSESFLYGLFEKWSVEPAESLQVHVKPRGNVLRRILLGKIKADVTVKFDKIRFRPIQVSNGTIEAKKLLLNLWSFTPEVIRKGATRYPSQFDFQFMDCVFTEEDLLNSQSIRNGLQQLLYRVLSRAGVSPNDVVVTSIRILENGKIACSGEATTAFSGRMPYEVRSRIGLTSRGHVVTFPGLEISLQPSLGLYLPVLPEIDLDIGHNACLFSLKIDGRKKMLTLSAKVTVTPEHTLKLKKYLQAKESYAACFTFDVGKWLTRIGCFS